MHYPNLLHYDPAYAAASRWGKLVAPQSFPIVVDDGHGSAPACVGCIPNSHLLFGGDEWWFYGPRVYGGDILTNERIPFDYVVKETKFAGPTCFQRGDNFYRNQRGELIAKQRSTSIRYLAEVGGENVNMEDAEEPVWTDEEIEALEERKFTWIKMLHDLGHKQRWWDDVKVGDQLPERVFGPHSVASFTTEWRAYIVNTWGSMNLRKLDLLALGFTPEMAGFENDPDVQRVNPEITDGAYYGPSRGHLFPRWARKIGMPRAYGYGASMGAWVTDYLVGLGGRAWHGRAFGRQLPRPGAFGRHHHPDRGSRRKVRRQGRPPPRPGQAQDGQPERHDHGHRDGGDPAAEKAGWLKSRLNKNASPLNP